jgi:DMSO/TMAO reductase YedYZ heme-binding membrane subunit
MAAGAAAVAVGVAARADLAAFDFVELAERVCRELLSAVATVSWSDAGAVRPAAEAAVVVVPASARCPAIATVATALAAATAVRARRAGWRSGGVGGRSMPASSAPNLRDGCERHPRRGRAPPSILTGSPKGVHGSGDDDPTMTQSTLLWDTARAAGIVSWALLAASALWGLALSTRALRGRPRQAWLLDLHRFLGAAALVFVAVHVVTIMLDTYVHFGLVEVLVPFAARWRTDPVAWGIVAMYLLAAVEITSLLRARLPKRVWDTSHYLAFPLFVLASVHALTAGTDRSAPALRLAVLCASTAVAALTALRVRDVARHGLSRDRGPMAPGAAAVRRPR